MSLVTKQVPVCHEVDTLLNVALLAVIDVKGGKTPAQIVTDLVPGFISALTGIGELAIESKDRKDLERTVALKLCELIDVLVPPVVEL